MDEWLNKKIVVGIAGASGAIYADLLIGFLQEHGFKNVHLVASKNARRIFKEECLKSLEAFDYPLHALDNYDVPFVSGSHAFDVMIVIPCSMGTLARIAHGLSDNVLTRAADVMLKEGKQLILVPRETPFSAIHCENMKILSMLPKVSVIPAIPSFYSRPKTIEQLAWTVVSRVLDHMGVQNSKMPRWKDDDDQ